MSHKWLCAKKLCLQEGNFSFKLELTAEMINAESVTADNAYPEGSSEEKGQEGNWLKKAKRYNRARDLLVVVRLGLNLIFIAGWLFTGISTALVRIISGFNSSFVLVNGLYFIAFTLSYAVFFLPVSFYEGYILEHRFGLSRENYISWSKDYLKALLLNLAIGILLVELLYLSLRAFPEIWWIVTGIFLVIFMVVLSNLTPKFIIPLFFKLKPLEDEELKGRLVNLAKRANTEVDNILEVELSAKTKTAEAALTGFGRSRRILLGDTILKDYSLPEIETVLAHELAHKVKRHIPKLVISQSIFMFIGLCLTHILMDFSLSYFQLGRMDDVANFPLLIGILGVFSLFTLPLANSYSRRLEKEADKYALYLTQKPEAFVSSMTKLAKQNLADIEPHPVIEFILYSHPSITKRIKLAEQYNK